MINKQKRFGISSKQKTKSRERCGQDDKMASSRFPATLENREFEKNLNNLVYSGNVNTDLLINKS